MKAGIRLVRLPMQFYILFTAVGLASTTANKDPAELCASEECE
jgi:hypothetical protein